jgi:hypothetical protein
VTFQARVLVTHRMHRYSNLVQTQAIHICKKKKKKKKKNMGRQLRLHLQLVTFFETFYTPPDVFGAEISGIFVDMSLHIDVAFQVLKANFVENFNDKLA